MNVSTSANKTINNYEAYLFDWDGTLAQSHEMWFDIFRMQLRRYGIELSDNELSHRILGRYYQGIQEFGIPEADIPGLIQELDATAKKRYPLIDMFPNAKSVLETLVAKHKKLAVITATPRKIFDAAIDRHNLQELFDVMVTGDQVKEPKPNPSGILKALKQLAVQPHQAVMCGDSPKDLQAAQNAGIDSLLFDPPEYAWQHSRDALAAAKPTYTIHSWQEMLDWLQ